MGIHQIFEQRATETPDAPALVFGHDRWSYKQLNERANQIAWRLRAMGVAPDSIVALELERSAETIAAVLGILKAGGAYAPLDPNDPPARRKALLADLKPVAIITETDSSRDQSTENIPSISFDRNLAYIMFTSGSTGTPKGVMVEHRSVIRLVRGANYVDLGPDQVLLQLAPLAFDASTFEIWGALLNGGTLVVMPPGLASLADIGRVIQENGITTMWLTAGLFHAMVDQQVESLTRLKQLLAGGDVLSPLHVRKFLDAAPKTRLINGYGPTENTTFTCCYTVPQDHPADTPIPIGTPISGTRVYLINEELYAGGEGVARGYLNQPQLTAERFLTDPYSDEPGALMYRTGDLVRDREDGVIEFLGRADGQIKLRGFRIEPGEIETSILAHGSVDRCVVIPSGERLVAYVVPNGVFNETSTRRALREKLPTYMVPAEFVVVEELPLTANGKVDRQALTANSAPKDARKTIVEVWREVLGIASPDPDTSFFDLGGSSLQLLRVQGLLEQRLHANLTIADLFQYPTINTLANRCKANQPVVIRPKQSSRNNDIAIIGMAARLPGAASVREFWNNLVNGVESITFFNDAELEAGGGPKSVKARPILKDVDQFDAAYFGMLPKEAETTDPQHRVFLECAVEALDDGGYDPSRYPGAIGVFAGCSPNTYFLRHVCSDQAFIDNYTGAYQVGNYQTMIGTSPDFLTTRVAYKLNLTGPSITMGTACSTSLVAVTQACSSLIQGECSMALAGGVSITFPQKRGYVPQEGGIASLDGHCRAFDADAQGTVFGDGCGVVLLKRLDDAIADGDSIYAVIKGYGINNDGAGKMGFTAPGVDGQAKAIRRAHEMAGVAPETITYVEAHGTGTPLGDPIEIAGLTQAFRGVTGKQFCAIGTAKTNVGHLDAAAGVTGLIKAALSVKYGLLPPTVHFRKPNPRIDFANSPFFVNDKLTPWKPEGMPRRAGVSAFGVGGTNAHVVLEEGPKTDAPLATSVPALMLLSAKSQASLDEATTLLETYIKEHPELNPGDVTFTLGSGRRRFEHRRMLLNGASASARFAGDVRVAFAFPGQGAQHPAMGRDLYRTMPVFRACVDECATILLPILSRDIRATLEADELNQTAIAQPSIFTIEYALARQWMAWGIHPKAMVGHSVGEFVAATLAGVFSLEDALVLVAERGRLMQELPGGAMLSVRAPEADVRRRLTPELAIAAVNSPALCVVAGPQDAVDAFEQRLTADKIACRKLRTSHAFHSPMVDPILGPLTERIRSIRLSEPQIPYVSTLTGQWITPSQATDPEYWARHCRETVQFSTAIEQLKKDHSWCVLEVGPGQALATLVRQHAMTAVSSLPDASSPQDETTAMWNALGRMWLCGIEPDWQTVLPGQRRVSLPGYSFDRKRFWIERKSGMTQVVNNNTVNTPTVTPNAQPDRLRSELVALLEDLSGMDLQAVGSDETFLEMGFDSLFLTQVTQSLEGKYGVKIRFAQLLDELSTLGRLTTYLEPFVPAPAPVAEAPVVAAPQQTPAAPEVSYRSNGIEQLMKDQLQAFADLTSRQLEVLRGAAPVAAAPVVVVRTPELVVPQAPPAPKTEAPKFETFGPFKPIQKGQTGGLNEHQSRYLATFIDRYTARTRESKRQTQLHRAHLADPRVAGGFRAQWKEMVYPIVIERSAGSKLWDVDGNEYIDILNGFGVTMFGHRPSFVEEAVAAQLKEGFEIGPQTPRAGEVAQLLCEMTGMERATFCNTGSEAVMAAMRLARTVTGKNKVVFFTGDYHGAFDEVLVKAAGRPGSAPKARPIAPGIPDEKAANVFVLEYGSQAALDVIRAHSHEIAAVMVEPVQSRHPNLRPVDFLRELRSITDQSNTALIFDEVVTGFRTHPGGMQAMFDIRADLATYGKVIGGGMPIGALAGSRKFMDALDGGTWQYGDESSPEVGVTFFAGTFVRHPLAMAACMAVLKHLKSAGPQLQEDLSEKTGRLVKQLNELFEQGQVPSRIENFRSIFYFGFPPSERFASLLHYHVREKGIHIQEGFPCFLTTAHTDADIERIVKAFRDSITEMQDGGFLPARTAQIAVAAPVAEPVATICEAPLTEAQMEIRLSAQMGEEESCSYNEGFTVRLRGQLNERALRESLAAVIQRHEALRATLTENGDQLRILPTLDIALPVIEAQNLDQLKDADARKPFDLVNGPLVRAQLVRVSPEDHVLFMTAHHMVCDGWSTNVILDELSELYTAKCQGGSAELPVPLRFSEYARSQAAQKVDSKVESYWVAEYSQPAPPLELPLDRPRPALKSYRGSTYSTSINAANYQRIKKAGAKQGSTLFSTLLGGFQALLSRLSGQSDIVIGIPSAAQSLLADQVLVGHCVNFLPIRMRLDGDPSFKDLLGQTKRKVLEAYDHQTYTYGTLVRKLAIPRNPSRLPLIEVQFNLERVGGNLKFQGLDAKIDQSPKRFVNFDIFLNVVESPEGLTLYCDYNTDLLDEATIARWIRHYETLLLGFADNADQPVSALPLLSTDDARTLITDWNATAATYPRDKSVHKLIEEQAVRTPDVVAVRFDGKCMSYAQLDRRANQLARWLRSQGVERHGLVGLSLEPSFEMLIGVLGVLKAGAAYVPIDPDYPQDRILFIRQDSGVALILTAANWPMLDQQPAAPLPSVDAGDLAYVMYTSGSTGKPKGVEISHRALGNFLWSMRREPGISPFDKLLAVTTLSFDIAGLELFLPLAIGAEVVIAGREAIRDGKALMDLIVGSNISIMQATPTTWKLLLEAGWQGNDKLKILCGGEELTRELANELAPRCASLWNMYGPTETTIWSTTGQVTVGEGPVSIGRPIDNTQIYVLDAKGQPTPIGVPGELCIGGDGLANGYWKRPELTADRFTGNPRVYRTGDLARYLPDGRLLCLGRIDNQVKIRGHRIELGEIEAALLSQPTVRDAAVVVREDVPGEKRLVAYLVGSASRSTLGDRLPDYMVPALYVEMLSLPLTPNGKIDRRALAMLPPPSFVSVDRYEAPRSEHEKALASVWEQVLHVGRVGLDDDLFSLGADSIHLFQIAARANREGLAITPKQLLQHRSVRSLSQVLTPAKPAVSAIKAVSREKFRMTRNN